MSESTSPQFRPGEVVDITIKGVRIARPRRASSVTIIDEYGVPYQMPPQAAVELVAPAEWPPRPGDLWRDRNGLLWFAVESLRSEVSHEPVLLTCNGRNRRPAAEIHDLYGPLTLVYREPEQDGGDR